jgi:hypothetical protein
VIEDAFVAAAEAEGLRVGDEVDLVAEGGQFDAEFRGHHAGAAVGGIAGDADAHGAGTAAVLEVEGVRCRDEAGDGCAPGPDRRRCSRGERPVPMCPAGVDWSREATVAASRFRWRARRWRRRWW